MGNLSEEAKLKIQELSQKDVPLKERRSWYNAMGRRFEKPAGLKAGLLEKYQQCQGNSNLRWEMLKAFMCDKDMNLNCIGACINLYTCQSLDFMISRCIFDLGPHKIHLITSRGKTWKLRPSTFSLWLNSDQLSCNLQV